MLTIDQIRAAARRDAVAVPEYGVTVYAVAFKATQRVAISQANTKDDDNIDVSGFMRDVIVATIVQESGDPWLSAAVADELPEEVFGRLYQASAQVNGLRGSAVEDAAKNSDAGRSDASPSDSPAT
jgi:hypothetical protein